MQHRAPLPPGVSATRVIAFVQGGLGMLTGLLLVFGGGAAATAYGFTGAGAGTVVAVIGVLVLAVHGLLIWGGMLLGSLSRGARTGVLVYEWLAVAFGLVGLLHPGLGFVSLVLAGVAVYYLQFDARTRAAFAAGAHARPGAGPAVSPPYDRPYTGPPPVGRGVQPAPRETPQAGPPGAEAP
ncbi:MAG TPA: hypothetical protein VH661_01430 [Candidatus Dormibacteraeota bacterium]|nr:hypothetical protein [Candidatus Dormibacteraeota bacterium]